MKTSSDPSTQNVDAERPPESGTTVASTGAYPVNPGEARLVQKWHRRIRMARAFDKPIRVMYARDRRYARGETGAEVSYSLIQAYIDILVAFLVARDPDVDCKPAENVGQAGLTDATDYGKTMEIVIRHLLKSARLKRKAARWVRSALTVGIGVLKASWQEVWGQDPHFTSRIRDAQKKIADIQVLMQRIREQDGDIEELQAQLNVMQKGLAERSEELIAAGLSMDLIRAEDMVYSIDNDSIIDTEECSWIGNRYFVDKEEMLSEFETLDRACVKSATMYAPREPKDKLSKESRYNGIVATVEDDESDAYKLGTGRNGRFGCAWEIWDADNGQFFTVIEGISDRFARTPQAPPCPTTKFDPYFLLSFTEVDGERHPQSYISRSCQLQDEIERTMTGFVEHRRRVKPKLGFDATSVKKTTINRLKNGTSEEYVAIEMVPGKEANTDIRKVLFPIAYAQIDMAIYSVEPLIHPMETVWGIQEALTSTVQVAKTATEADIQQAGTQAKTGFKRDVIEDKLTDIAIYCGECASYRLNTDEVRQIAGPQAFWIENATPEDLHNMIQIDIRAGSTGKPDNTARREAWAAVQPQLLQLMQIIANFRQTPPPMFANNLEAMLIETAERMGEQLDAQKFVPQAPQAPILGPGGLPLSNDQVSAAAAAQAGAQQPPQGGGKPPESNQPTSGQERLAPTTVPPAIAG